MKKLLKNLSQFAILIAFTLSACNSNVGGLPTNNRMNGASVSKQQANFSIENATIATIHQGLATHQITCEGLINMYLDRIRQYDLSVSNGNAPLNAISEINPKVIEDAKHLDQLYAKTGQMPGDMFCVPVVVKDSIDVIGTNSTAGSYALLGAYPMQDAPLVSALRNANAIILGKATMNEFGFFASSSRDGQAGNAYDTTKDAHGSSSGSAVAVATNLAVVSIGVDSGGSIRMPAGYNGVYGLRPTYGLVNAGGSFNMEPLTSVAGPMARTVTDLAVELGVIASTSQNKSVSYVNNLDKQSLQNKRIGVVRLIGDVDVIKGLNPISMQAFNNAQQNLQSSGATVIEVDLPEFIDDAQGMMGGGLEDVSAYLATLTNTSMQSFSDICKSGKTVALGSVETCIAASNAVLPHKGDPMYKKAVETIEKDTTYLDKIMTEKKLDGLIMLIGSGSATTQNSVDALQSVIETKLDISSFTGMPSMVIQIGVDNVGMPIAMELVGKKYSEGKLLGMAYAYEQNHGGFQPPKLISDDKLNNMSIEQLNNIFTTVGITMYNQIMLPNLSNVTTSEQSQQITNQVITTEPEIYEAKGNNKI